MERENNFRKIKFRAWDKRERFMIEPIKSFLNFTKEGNVACLEDQDINNIILMQYTWLKDKNGKEIYEGDIVKSLWKNDYSFGIREVIFKDWAFTIEWYWLIGSLVEIIWNIYQHPNLLNKD